MTTKTLKDLFEVYKPKSPDEQKFVDKHVTIKHKDRNGNDDDVFKGNTKYIKRKEERKGYDVGEDEKVYEETDVEESYGAASKRAEASRQRAIKNAAKAYKTHGNMDRAIKDHDLFAKDAVKIKAHLGEEVEDLEELSKSTIKSYASKALSTPYEYNSNGDIKYTSKTLKRQRGANKALDKLTGKAKVGVQEEVEEIDELSHDTLRRYRMKAKSIGDHEKGDINYRAKGRELAGRKTYGGRVTGIEKAKVMAKEEVEDLDESTKIAAHLIKRYGDNVRKSHVVSAAKDFGVDASKLAKAVRTKLGKTTLGEEVELEEGMMKLSKVHIVHHHDHPAAKEFAKNYTAGMKGDHRESGPNEADEKASNAFHQRYTGVRTREGFAGSGTHVYTDHKTGAKWKVDRHPNGKTFYGTDHIISHHTGPIHESFDLEEGEVLDTVAEDRVLRSLVAYYEELGEEVLIDDIIAIAEEMIDELSVNKLDQYRSKARQDLIDADANDDNRLYNKRAKGYVAASRKVQKKLTKEEVENLDELSKGKLAAYIPKAEDSADELEVKGIKGDNASWRKMHKRLDSVLKAKHKWIHAKEEVEEIDELSKPTLASYAKKAGGTGLNSAGAHGMDYGVKVGSGTFSKKSKDAALKKATNRAKGVERAITRLTKEDVINITLQKLSPVLEDVEPLTPEERLVSKLDGLSEGHIHLLLSLFENLNEDNQTKMLSAVDTKEGIDGLIDFAIENRGE